MDDGTKKLLKKQGDKVVGAGSLVFEALFGDHEAVGRRVARQAAEQFGHPELARELARPPQTTPSKRSESRTNPPSPDASTVVDGEFEEDDDL